MGYSFATPMKSPKAKAHMLAFMAEHYRGLSDIAPDVFVRRDYDASRFLTDDLDYDDGPSKVGFNYSALMGAGRYYCTSILGWMALRAGRTRRFNKLSKGFSAPYYVYDGYESTPVLDAAIWAGRLAPGARFRATGSGVMDPEAPTQLEPGVYHIQWGDRGVSVSVVDPTGYHTSPFHFTKYPDQAEEKALIEPIVKAELARLTELWAK
jgi:hypothetical protein